MRSRVPLSIAGLVLTGLSLLFLFFLILSGVSNHTPFNRTYFLQADTSGLSGARDTTRWTYFWMCGRQNYDCGKAHAAPAFGSAWDGNAVGVPNGLDGSRGGDTTSSYYYYMWRFGWVFFLIALFFTTIAFFGSFLACCGRIGSLLASLAGLTALVFWTIAVVLMTVTFVKARNAFRRDGRDANIGTYAFAWAWAGWASLLLASLLFCGGIRKKDDSRRHYDRGTTAGTTYNNATYNNTTAAAYDDGTLPAGTTAAPRTRRFWNRRGDAYDSRRVKDEYN